MTHIQPYNYCGLDLLVNLNLILVLWSAGLIQETSVWVPLYISATVLAASSLHLILTTTLQSRCYCSLILLMRKLKPMEVK